MKIISATFADLEHSDIGTASRLTRELNGQPIFSRTVERIVGIDSMTAHYVLTPRAQIERVNKILCDLPVTVVGIEGQPNTWRALVQSSRKWSLDGWRGGIGGTTYFDEFCSAALLSQLINQVSADAVFAYPAAAPLLSTELILSMIEHHKTIGDDARLIFTQAPPGIAGLLLDTQLIRELAQTNSPVGTVLSYKPDAPRKDLIFHPACMEIPTVLRFAGGRLVADTDRALACITDLLREHPNPDAETIGQWLIDREDHYIDPLPSEIEIELTTDTRYPNSLTRATPEPHASACATVPPSIHRGPLDPTVLKYIASEIAELDDTLIVLGGHGDPLRHPDLTAVLSALATPDRPYGIAIRTHAVDVTPEIAELLVDHRVDILCVTLDAWTPDGYRAIHGPNADLETVLARINRLGEIRHTKGSAVPIVVPEFCKIRENVSEMDAFFDGWLRRTGTASIVGYSHLAGQREDRSVIDMQPPVRHPCRRIRNRCVVLANGDITLCDQDLLGEHSLGSLRDASLREIWQSAEMNRVRNLHQSHQWADHALCNACTEWHRP